MELLPALDSETDLLRERTPLPYNEAEQQFSSFVHRRLYRLLRGEENSFLLIRRYCGGNAGAAFLLPSRLDAGMLRPGVAEDVILGVLRFLDPFSPGGPIAQTQSGGRLTETQTFPTQYPHIIVERVDVYEAETRECLSMEWQAVRLQNQRKSTMVNRALDLGNFAIELARMTGLH